ncbi:MAG: ClpXP protease specificity-enhancing factor [Gammaproteobacteria bacterium]
MSVDQHLPRRPYLLRAMHQWMSDSGMTPHVLVDTYVAGVDVPKAHVRDGRIVLNIGLAATRHLDLGNEWISFEARFAGVPRVVRIPVVAVLSIYARETGEGMVFPPEGELAPPAALLAPRLPDSAAPRDVAAPGGAPGATSGAAGPPPPRGPSRPRPNLKVVK